MNLCFSTKTHKTLSILLFYFILLTLNRTAQSDIESCGFLKSKYHVKIANTLTNGPENNIRAYCASSDKEIGYKTIEPFGGFIFEVCIKDYWFTPIYKCHIRWGNKLVTAEVVNADIIEKDCKPNYWDGQRRHTCDSFVSESGLHMNDLLRKPIPWIDL
ncbi:hypothetical protein CASFOL_037751 [Castilleja foliolosa]|uniref:S-protein homolog n=1 Tax=Castilleja foliolosa TaxID=1961234 RepID=A0ABD3BJ12_9LAMI